MRDTMTYVQLTIHPVGEPEDADFLWPTSMDLGVPIVGDYLKGGNGEHFVVTNRTWRNHTDSQTLHLVLGVERLLYDSSASTG